MNRDPIIDRLIGRALAARAKWLLRHGNPHEARHYLAALEAGDSTACDGGHACRLDMEALDRYNAALFSVIGAPWGTDRDVPYQ